MKLTKSDFEKYYDEALDWVIEKMTASEKRYTEADIEAAVLGVMQAMKRADENESFEIKQEEGNIYAIR